MLRYVASTADAATDAATDAFMTVLGAELYLREYEKLAVCKAGLGMRSTVDLAGPFADLAVSDPSHLVRARALLAWGVHSADHDFEAADAFWSATSSTWKAYPFVAIQRKPAADRDARYERWSGEGRYLGRLAEELRASPIRLTKT